MGIKDNLGETQYGRNPNDFTERVNHEEQAKNSRYSLEGSNHIPEVYTKNDPNPATQVHELISKTGLNPLSLENSDLSITEGKQKYVPAGRGSKFTTTEPFIQKYGPGENEGYLDQDFTKYPYAPKVE